MTPLRTTSVRVVRVFPSRVTVVVVSAGTPLGRAVWAFLLNPVRVLSHGQSMDLRKGRIADRFDRTVDVQISRLWTKLGENPRDPKIVQPVRNAGYIFTAEVRR